MTLEEARTEADRRWARAGHAERRSDGRCYVGTVGGEPQGNGTFPYGIGWTWEEAFADAERRAS